MACELSAKRARSESLSKGSLHRWFRIVYKPFKPDCSALRHFESGNTTNDFCAFEGTMTAQAASLHAREILVIYQMLRICSKVSIEEAARFSADQLHEPAHRSLDAASQAGGASYRLTTIASAASNICSAQGRYCEVR